jgi:hypothetical protein
MTAPPAESRSLCLCLYKDVNHPRWTHGGTRSRPFGRGMGTHGARRPDSGDGCPRDSSRQGGACEVPFHGAARALTGNRWRDRSPGCRRGPSGDSRLSRGVLVAWVGLAVTVAAWFAMRWGPGVDSSVGLTIQRADVRRLTRYRRNLPAIGDRSWRGVSHDQLCGAGLLLTSRDVLTVSPGRGQLIPAALLITDWRRAAAVADSHPMRQSRRYSNAGYE